MYCLIEEPFVIVSENKRDEKILSPPPVTMKTTEFLEELKRIEEDLEGMGRPCSPCVYFHGREKLFSEDQFKAAVEFFLKRQEKVGMPAVENPPPGTSTDES